MAESVLSPVYGFGKEVSQQFDPETTGYILSFVILQLVCAASWCFVRSFCCGFRGVAEAWTARRDRHEQAVLEKLLAKYAFRRDDAVTSDRVVASVSSYARLRLDSLVGSPDGCMYWVIKDESGAVLGVTPATHGSPALTRTTAALSVQPEMAVPGSVLEPAIGRAPRGSLSVYALAADGVPYCLGQATRVVIQTPAKGTKPVSYLVSATHVVRAGVYLTGPNAGVTVRLHDTIHWKYMGDLAIGTAPDSVWTMLGAQGAYVRQLMKQSPIILRVATGKAGVLEQADGSALLPLPSREYPWGFTHSCSTRPGHSGAALRDKQGYVVGVHCGAVTARGTNMGIALWPAFHMLDVVMPMHDRVVAPEDSRDEHRDPFYEYVDRLISEGYSRQAAYERAEDQRSQDEHDAEEDWRRQTLYDPDGYSESQIAFDHDEQPVYANNRGQYSRSRSSARGSEPSDSGGEYDDGDSIDQEAARPVRVSPVGGHPPSRASMPASSPQAAGITLPTPAAARVWPCPVSQGVALSVLSRPVRRVYRRDESSASIHAENSAASAAIPLDAPMQPGFPQATPHRVDLSDNTVASLGSTQRSCAMPTSAGSTNKVEPALAPPSSKRAAKKPRKPSGPSAALPDLQELTAQARRIQSEIARLSSLSQNSGSGGGRQRVSRRK